MSYSALRVFAQRTSFQQVRSAGPQALAQNQQSLKISSLDAAPQSAQSGMCAQFGDKIPEYLRTLVDGIFADALELNTEQSLNVELEKDIAKWAEVQAALGQPLQSSKDTSVYTLIVQTLEAAAQGKLGYCKTPLEFIQKKLREILQGCPAWLWLALIVDFVSTPSRSGLQYLIDYFKRTGVSELAIDKSASLVVTQTGYNHVVKRSHFQEVFQRFLRGELSANNQNLLPEAQTLIADLNKLIQLNYDEGQYAASLEASKARLSASSRRTTLMQSQSVYGIEEDAYYRLLQGFLAGEPTEAPFAIQVFFDLIRGTSQAVGNAKLFLMALRRDFKGLFFEMQRAGLYGELFVLQFFLAREMEQYGVYPENGQHVDRLEIAGALTGRFSSIQGGFQPGACFARFVHQIRDLFMEVNPAALEQKWLGAVPDFCAAQVQYYQLQYGANLKLQKPEQLYLLSQFFIEAKEFQKALELLQSMAHSEDMGEQQLYCVEKLTLEVLFKPENVNWLRERCLELTSNEEQAQLRRKLCLDLIDMSAIYHGGKMDLRAQVLQVDAQLHQQLSVVLEEGGAVLGRFLVLAAARAGVLQQIMPTIARFELDEDTKRIVVRSTAGAGQPRVSGNSIIV